VFRNLLIAGASTLTLSGCAFHTAPFVTYSDPGRPLSDTSVFSVRGFQAGGALSQIYAVDGAATSCWQVGCPIWVRVLPGSHSFHIKYSIFNNGIASHLVGEADVEVKDMKARHVYLMTSVAAANLKTFSTATKDLGENPDYVVHVSGVRGGDFRATFDER